MIAGGFRTSGLPVGLVSGGPIPQDFHVGKGTRLSQAQMSSTKGLMGA